MTDKIDFGGEPWQAIPRSTLRDPRLSHRAKGGLVILLSHEEGWVRSCIAVLQREGKGGRKQAQAIMAELRDLGYAELVHERDGNLVRSHYVVRAKSVSSSPRLDGASDLPETGPVRSGSTGNGAAVVEALEEEPLEEELVATSNTPRESADFVEFYENTYPRREGRGEARKAWTKAIGKAAASVILAGAARFADDPNRDPAFTPHPATWLNQERWLDDPLPERMNGREAAGRRSRMLAQELERQGL